MSAYTRTHLAHSELTELLATRVAHDFATTAALLADLAEFDERKLWVPAAQPSLLSYCTEVLHLSKDSALKRIQAARAAREFPTIFEAVAEARIHLAGVCLLAPRLTPENAEGLLKAAEHQSKAEIERLLAERFPRSEVLPMVQPLPATPPYDRPRAIGSVDDQESHTGAYAPGHTRAALRAEVTPLSAQSFELHFSIGAPAHDKLRHAQQLLSHSLQPGDLAGLFERALDCLIARTEKRKLGATERPRRRTRPTTSQRHIPAEVRWTVWERDGGQCTFVSEDGQRCPARTLLQFDHAEPVARGGTATVANIRMRCATHNAYAAEQILGARFMREKREQARRAARAGGNQGRDATATVHAAQAEADSLKEQELDVIAALRGLGVSADRARRAAGHCMSILDATLEERLRSALQSLRPPARCTSAPPS